VFLGHFALAFGAKKILPRVSLGTTVLAAQLADALWPLLLLLGLEEVRIAPGITAVTPLDFVAYPYSHSLAALAVWAGLFGLVHLALRRERTSAWVLGLLVLSHWVLDALSHRPDMPVYPGGPLVGAGLWFSLPATLAVEFGLYLAGVWIYLAHTRARDRTGSLALWCLVALLVVLYLGATFGPPPPSVHALAASALAGWLFVPWAYWIDRHRPSTTRT
jgi:hypothetical protein